MFFLFLETEVTTNYPELEVTENAAQFESEASKDDRSIFSFQENRQSSVNHNIDTVTRPIGSQEDENHPCLRDCRGAVPQLCYYHFKVRIQLNTFTSQRLAFEGKMNHFFLKIHQI